MAPAPTLVHERADLLDDGRFGVLVAFEMLHEDLIDPRDFLGLCREAADAREAAALGSTRPHAPARILPLRRSNTTVSTV
jgi:hypothetical protein